MKTTSLLLILSATMAANAGCKARQVCKEHPSLCEEGGSGTGGGSQGGNGGSGGAGGQGGQGGDGGGVPAGCDPRTEAKVGDTCGVFVDTAATGTESGTPNEPFHSLTAALAQSPARVYVCSSALDEAVVVGTSVQIFGGLNCADWTSGTTKTQWSSDAGSTPLTIASGGSGSLLYQFAIHSKDASGFDETSLQGASSIGAIIDGATVTLESVDITAGAGAPGGDGDDIAGRADGRQSDAPGFDGNQGGDCGGTPGGPKSHICGADTTTGGAGGSGDHTIGLSGVNGSPNPSLGEPDGSAGAGDTGAGGWDCSVDGGNGQNGHPGPVGTGGPGGAEDGSIAVTGYVGDPGQSGTLGPVGQGGGGGGGRRGNGQNGCGGSQIGPSGGSGGAGGCGGDGGGGGGAGGASIALLVLNADVTLTNVALTASAGGVGGAGGDGQLGGLGGASGLSAGGGCSGGQGGTGGQGGSGGGGRGGPSIGIAYTTAPPEHDGGTIAIATEAAMGGPGGNGNSQGNAGAAGDLANTAMFE